MSEVTEQQKLHMPAPRTYLILAGAAILHALILMLTIKFNLGKEIISCRRWVVLVWFWFLWPIILLIHPARSLRRWLIPVGVGLLLLLTCWAEIYVFTAWSIDGFAP